MLKKMICISLLTTSQSVFADNAADPMCDRVVKFMEGSDKILIYFQAQATKAGNATFVENHEFTYSVLPSAGKKKGRLLGSIFDEATFHKDEYDKKRGKFTPMHGVTSQNKIPYAANSYNIDDKDEIYRILTEINHVANTTITLEEPKRATVDSSGVVPAKKGKYRTFAWGISKMCLDKKGCDEVQLDDFVDEKIDSDEEPETVKKHFRRGDWFFISMDELDKLSIKDKDVWGFVYPSTQQLPSVADCLPAT